MNVLESYAKSLEFIGDALDGDGPDPAAMARFRAEQAIGQANAELARCQQAIVDGRGLDAIEALDAATRYEEDASIAINEWAAAEGRKEAVDG